MKDITSIDILIAVIVVLGGLVGFLGTIIINQLLKGNELLNKTSVQLAVITVQVQSNEKNIERLEKEKEKTDLELYTLRNDVKDIGKRIFSTQQGRS